VVPRPTVGSAQHTQAPAAPSSAKRAGLKSVVVELLEAAQIEPFTGPPERQEVNLAALARELCAGRPRCRVEALEALMGGFEGARMRQLLEHLLDNALTYDSSGGMVQVRVWSERDRARLSVTDRGYWHPG
jgi:signal transduction histidine kinase